MNKQDKIRDWMKEIPAESPSNDFTNRVMMDVMMQWDSHPVAFKPIISRKGWWIIGSIAVVITIFLVSLQNAVVHTSATAMPTNYGMVFDQAISPLVNATGSYSPLLSIGLLAIAILWGLDRFLSRMVRNA